MIPEFHTVLHPKIEFLFRVSLPFVLVTKIKILFPSGWRWLSKERKGCLQTWLLGIYFSRNVSLQFRASVWEQCFFSTHTYRNWAFNVSIIVSSWEDPPPLCSSSSSCSLEISSKDPRVSGNRTDLFFTLKQKGDWERHSVRTCCSSVEKDLLLMHTHPISPHCYLKLNTSGFGEHTGRGLLSLPVIVTWGPQSQVLWEGGSRATAVAHICANCKRGQLQGRQMKF